MSIMDWERVSSTRYRWNPFDAIAWSFGLKKPVDPAEFPWITYDPHVIPQYRIRRGSTHDGTMVFGMELGQKVLSGVLKTNGLGWTYYKPEPIAEEDWPRVRYTVGDVRIASVFGPMEAPWGRRALCQRERWTLPVRVSLDPEPIYLPGTTQYGYL